MGLFTPDMAFEDVVKDQIRKLVQPSMKCIDLVSTELGEVVQKCGEGVSHSHCTHAHTAHITCVYCVISLSLDKTLSKLKDIH